MEESKNRKNDFYNTNKLGTSTVNELEIRRNSHFLAYLSHFHPRKLEASFQSESFHYSMPMFSVKVAFWIRENVRHLRASAIWSL